VCETSDSRYQCSVVVAVLEAEQLERARAEQQQLEVQRKQREEERWRLDEEARQCEQQALEELQRQPQVKSIHVVFINSC